MQIFVYGTLKKGECRSAILREQNFRYMARTKPDYRMFRLKDYPGLVEVEPGAGRAIVGEVWEVDSECISKLDLVEGVREGFYVRRGVRLHGGPQHEQVEAYFYLKSVLGCEDCGDCW